MAHGEPLHTSLLRSILTPEVDGTSMLDTTPINRHGVTPTTRGLIGIYMVTTGATTLHSGGGATIHTIAIRGIDPTRLTHTINAPMQHAQQAINEIVTLLADMYQHRSHTLAEALQIAEE